MSPWGAGGNPARRFGHDGDMSTRRGLAFVVVLGALTPSATAAPDETPDDFGIRCVDASTGTQAWQSTVEEGWPARLRVDGKSLWEDHGGGWKRRDLASGAVRGTGAPPDAAAAAPQEFWTTTDAILHDKDGKTGTIVQTAAFVDDIAVAGSVLTFTLDRDDGQVYGFDLDTGKLRWLLRPRERVDGFEAGDGSRVELLGDRLLVFAPPALLSVDPASGAVAWIARVPQLAGRWGKLRAIVDGDRWVVSVDGAVVSIDPETGTVAWTSDAGDGGATALVAGGGATCFDRRDEAVDPFDRDEAEIARDVEITIAGGAVTGARWVHRADVPAGADRVPLLEVPADPGGQLALRLELATPDATLTRDLSKLATGGDRTVYVEVPGAWETAALVDGAATRVEAKPAT
jgi:hypothetical protein